MRNYLLKKKFAYKTWFKKFDKSLSKTFSTQFINLLTLAKLSQKSKQIVLKSKISNKDKKFETLPSRLQNSKKLLKYVWLQKKSFKSFEIGLTYNKDEAFL